MASDDGAEGAIRRMQRALEAAGVPYSWVAALALDAEWARAKTVAGLTER